MSHDSDVAKVVYLRLWVRARWHELIEFEGEVRDHVKSYVSSMWNWIVAMLLKEIPPSAIWGWIIQGFFVLVCIAGYTIWPALFGHSIPTGAAIAALGFAAVIMTVRADKFSKGEKILWVVIAFVLLVVEVRVIEGDRSQQENLHDIEMARQQQEFAATLDKLSVTENNTRETSKRETRHFEALLQEEKNVFSGMQNSERNTLSALTGGDSYDVISPIFLSSDPHNAAVPLMISVRGKNLLWDVTVEMEEGPIDAQFEASHVAEYFAGKLRTTVNLGSVSTTYARPIGIVVHPNADRTNLYLFSTFSRSRLTTEELDIRFDAIRKSWDCSWKIHHEGPEIINQLAWGAPRETYPQDKQAPQ